MFRLIEMEFYKLWKRRSFLVFLCCLYILNLGMMALSQNIESPRPYQKFQNIIKEIPNEERYDYIEKYYYKIEAFQLLYSVENLQNDVQKNKDLIANIFSDNLWIKDYQTEYKNHKDYLFTNNLDTESDFINKIYAEMNTLHEYPQYIQNILNKAKTISDISVFKKVNDFSQKNLLKSANDYEKCLTIPITYESEKAISESLSFPLSHFIVVIAIIGIAMFMIMEEKEKNLFVLIQTTSKGQIQTIISKCIVMCLTIGVFSSLLVISQLFYMSLTYGLGDMTRSLQSLASYTQSFMQIQVWQYFILYIFIRWIVLCLIGFFIIYISLLCRNRVTCFFIVTVFFIIEFVCYIFVSPLGSLYLLKYINIISILQTDQLFQIYKNVGVFSNIISLQSLIIIVSILIYIIVIIFIIKVYQRKNLQIVSFSFPNIFRNYRPSFSLWKQELYKILWLQKVGLLIIVCIMLQFYQYSQIQIYKDQDHLIYQNYLSILEGSLTQEKEAYIVSEKQKFEDLNRQLMSIYKNKEEGIISNEEANRAKEGIEVLLQNQDIFKKVYQQYERIQDNPQLQFVMENAYEELLISPTWVIVPYILLFIFLNISLSQVYSYDYQNNVNQLMNITPLGNYYLRKRKILISISITCLFFFIINLPPVLVLQKTYGFTSLTAPIQSIEQFQNFPIIIPLWGALLLFYIIRLFSVISVVSFLHFIEVKTKSHLITILILNTVVVIPLILIYSQYHIMESISIYPLLMNILFLKDKQISLFIVSCFFILLTFISLHYLIKGRSLVNKIYKNKQK